MTKLKAIIETSSSKNGLTVKLNTETDALYKEVKTLLKKTDCKMNLNAVLQPLIKDVLTDAKHQLLELERLRHTSDEEFESSSSKNPHTSAVKTGEFESA